MDSSAPWDMTPRQSVEQECARRGEADPVPRVRAAAARATAILTAAGA
jgi:hypothetical protein